MSHKSRRRTRTPQNWEHNRHHLCYQRKMWNNGSVWLLRNYWYLVVDLPVGLHNQIHREVPTITAPTTKEARNVYERLQVLESVGAIQPEDSVELRLAIIIPMFEELNPKVAKGFKKQLQLISDTEKKKRQRH